MLYDFKVNLGNLLLSLSDAVDMASPSIAAHQLRTGYIAWRLARTAGLSAESERKIFKAALLHDIGALSPEDKIKLHDFEDINPEPHCLIGELLFRMASVLEESAPVVRFHHRKWRDWHTSIESHDVLESQILFLSDLVERLIRRDVFILHQTGGITARVAACAGGEIHSGVVDAFAELAASEDFWLDLTCSRLYGLLLEHGPLRGVEVGFTALQEVARLFRNLIDFKSSFTATHSVGVTQCALELSRIAGFSEFELQCMEIAGNLHDLGKLAIPLSILEKPAMLNDEEYAVMKQHPYHTYMVLNNMGGLEEIAKWAAFHHEYLNGSGYPFHMHAEHLPLGSRIMAVADIFTSLSEERPHRGAKDRSETVAVLKEYAGSGLLDTGLVDVTLENYDFIREAVSRKQEESRRYYERRLQVNQAELQKK